MPAVTANVADGSGTDHVPKKEKDKNKNDQQDDGVDKLDEADDKSMSVDEPNENGEVGSADVIENGTRIPGAFWYFQSSPELKVLSVDMGRCLQEMEGEMEAPGKNLHFETVRLTLLKKKYQAQIAELEIRSCKPAFIT